MLKRCKCHCIQYPSNAKFVNILKHSMASFWFTWVCTFLYGNFRFISGFFRVKLVTWLHWISTKDGSLHSKNEVFLSYKVKFNAIWIEYHRNSGMKKKFLCKTVQAYADQGGIFSSQILHWRGIKYNHIWHYFNMRLETCNFSSTFMRTLSIGKWVHYKTEFDLEPLF